MRRVVPHSARLYTRFDNNSFKAVQIKWADAWNCVESGIMLGRTNGFRALMQIFGHIYTSIASPGEFVKKEQFLDLFNRVNEDSSHFTIENFKPGNSGAAALKNFLEKKIFER